MPRVAPSPAPRASEPPLRPDTNRILAALAPEDRKALDPAGQCVRVSRGTLLCTPGDEMRYAYFPLRGVLSILALSADGGSLQIALVDARGFAGVPILLQGPAAPAPYQVAALFPCDLYRVRAHALASEAQRRPRLQASLLAWAQRHVTALGQAAICYHFHTVGQRLSRILLACATGLRSDRLEITQEQLAQLLGAPRSAISRAAVQFQDRGWIRLRHGRIWIVNRAGLASAACECHDIDTPTPRDGARP
jgi:CRP-like cAMP-binding protein